MSKIILTVIIIFVSTITANAAELSIKTATQYIGNNGSAVVKHAVQQTNIFIPLPGGFYADIWNSLATEGSEKEIDWTAGWTGSIANLDLNIGVSYYDFDALFFSKGDVLNPCIEISKAFKISESQTVTPSLKFETPILVNDGSIAGVFTHVGVKHVWQASDQFSVTQNVKIMYDNGVYGMDDGFVGKYSMSLGMTVTKSITLNALMDISKPFGSIHDRKIEITPGVGVTIKF